MNDVFPVLLVAVAGGVLVAAASAGFSQREQKWVTISFFMHVGFACAQVPLTRSFFGGGDMFLYFSYGEILAQMMERDPLHVIPEVTALLMHNQPRLPLVIIGAGSGTGTMSALIAWTFYLLGPSKYAASVAFAMFSLCGKIAMYRVFRANVDPALRFPVAIAALFVPSFVFWSSGLIKEAVVIAGFGWSFYGLHLWIREGRPISGWALMMAGAVPMLLIKPYILFPLILAGGSWYYWARSLRQGRVRIRPAHFAVAAALGIGGIVVLGRYFPEYGLDNFTTRTSDLQQLGRRGGSAYTLTGATPTTLVGQFVYAPAALLTSLFRPFLFEVHNIPALVNAMETTVLTILFARGLFTRNLGNVRRQIAENPLLVFCVVFVAAFGIAVGLATSNMGTLSRYRSPLLPFFVVLLLVLGKPLRARAPFAGSKNQSSVGTQSAAAELLSRVT
jgi:hypothetical protein